MKSQTAYRSSHRGVALLLLTAMLVGLLPPQLWAIGSLSAAAHAAESPLSAGSLMPEPASQPPTTSATEPEAVALPLSLSRVQSSYQAGGTGVITFTVTNHRPPVVTPALSGAGTLTETAEILQTFEPADDPNTIHDVVLTDRFTEATLQGSSHPADHDGERYLWNIGALPPQATRSVTMTVALPESAADFIALDEGATAYGTLRGRMVSAATSPTLLAPDGFEQWLIRTPDANTHDEQMLAKAAAVGQEGASLFQYVRSLGFEAYSGSMRGTRGALWSEAGNSVDQSSLLIAMLRASGIPARYRHGNLSVSDAQVLIASMFPTPTGALGHIPPGAPTSDPLNDPSLIAEVRDHWWVEAYLPGEGWTDLDPSFQDAAIGDLFATPAGDASDRIAELSASLRHTVTVAVRIEQSSAFPLGAALQSSYPLTHTFNSAELAGLPLDLSFMVQTEHQGGIAFANVFHYYTPYVRIGDSAEVYDGTTWSDLLTNFPLASSYTTAAWIEVESRTPDGTVDSYVREIKDYLGPAARSGGGHVELPPLGTEPFLSGRDVVQLWVTPHSYVPESETERALARLMEVSPEFAGAYQSVNQLPEGDRAAFTEWVVTNADTVQATQLRSLEHLATSFYAASTAQQRMGSSEQLLVKSYPDTPKLLLMTQSPLTDTMKMTFELLDIRERSIAYPGQSPDAVLGANFMRSTTDKAIEHSLLSQLSEEGGDSAYRTMLAAHEQLIPMLLLTSSNLTDLESTALSDEARARISAAAAAGRMVVVPTEPAMVEGEARTGWIEIDDTGLASYVNEQGIRASAVEYAMQMLSTYEPAGSGAASIGGLVGVILNFTQGLFEAFVEGGFDKLAPMDLAQVVAEAILTTLGECRALTTFAGDCAAGLAAGATLITGVAMSIGMLSGDPSLPAAWLDPTVVVPPSDSATAVLARSATHGAGALVLSDESANLSLRGALSAEWEDSIQHGLWLQSLQAADVTLYRNGVSLGEGALTLAAPTGATIQGAPLGSTLDAVGSTGFFAPALDGLALGSAWQSYSATLDSTLPYTITLQNGSVLLDGVSHTGALTAVVNDEAHLTGTLDGAAPTFAPSATFDLHDAELMVGPLSGSATAGGVPVDGSNGLALSGYDDALTIEDTGSRDRVTLNGSAEWFALTVTPLGGATMPGTPARFAPSLQANFSDDYRITAHVPPGWSVDIEGDGTINATPPAGTAPGEYTILIDAEASGHPALFVSALQSVTVTEATSIGFAIAEDPFLTIPMGTVADPSSDIPNALGHRVNGQAEIPGAAYSVYITNTTSLPHTFDLDVSGLPSGWTLLTHEGRATSTSIDLPPGATARTGLYISPVLSALPAAGSAYDVTVEATAQGDPTLSEQLTFTWTLPPLPFPYPRLSPESQVVAAGDIATVDVMITNAGNVSGAFPVAFVVHDSPWNGAPVEPEPLVGADSWTTPMLTPGETVTHSVSIATTGVEPGEALWLQATADEGLFMPAAYAGLYIASPESAPIFGAGTTLAACMMESAPLSDALNALGLAVSDLALSCEDGSCDLAMRDAVVARAEAVAYHTNLFSPSLPTAEPFLSIAASMAGHSSASDLQSDIQALGAAAEALGTQVCAISAHQPYARWTPVIQATLPDAPVTYTLSIENRGSIATTYAVTVAHPGGPTTFTEAIAPGESVSRSLSPDPTTLGLHNLVAEVVATGPDVEAGVGVSATARLYVVERFVQVLAVAADPAFVETGSSSSDLSVRVANVANVPRAATASLEIKDVSGAVWHADSVPLTLPGGPPITHPLGSVDTSGWAAGLYTITVNLLDDGGALLPDGSGYGHLSVGQALGISHDVAPDIVAPGTVTVTTVITSELLVDTILPDRLPREAAPLGWTPTGMLERSESDEQESRPTAEEKGDPATEPERIERPPPPHALPRQLSIPWTRSLVRKALRPPSHTVARGRPSQASTPDGPATAISPSPAARALQPPSPLLANG